MPTKTRGTSRIIYGFCLQSTLVANNYNFRLVMVLLGPAIANSQLGENKKDDEKFFHRTKAFPSSFLFSAAQLKHCFSRADITSLKIKVFVTHYLSAQKPYIILRSTTQTLLPQRNLSQFQNLNMLSRLIVSSQT